MADSERFVVELNFNTIEIDSWIEPKVQSDGSIKMIGMSSRLEKDQGGNIVSFSKSPTGIVLTQD